MRILVAGSSGWIGKKVVQTAMREGHYVRFFDYKLGFDLCDPVRVSYALDDGIEMVINCAGEIREAKSIERPYEHWKNNCLAAAVLFEVAAFRKVPVLHLSSPAVLTPNLPYGASKLGAEIAAASVNRRGGDIRVYRLFNIYGPGQPEDFAVPLMLRKHMAGEQVTVGHNVRDYVYIDDVAKILVREAVESVPTHEITDIGRGIPTSDSELCDLAGAVVGEPRIPHVVSGEPLSATVRIATPRTQTRGWTDLIDGMVNTWESLRS